jgi:hypothetical protein
MKYAIIIPAVLVAAAVALYAWLAYDFNLFGEFEEMYD